jgi:hypothetical protein
MFTELHRRGGDGGDIFCQTSSNTEIQGRGGEQGRQRQTVLKIISTISTTSTGRPTPAKSRQTENLAYRREIDNIKKFWKF